MVQVDVSQLSKECNGWREKLRSYRDEITHNEVRLRKTASLSLSKEQLKNVEHFHNQFHIQLINIHDLKQKIKTHDRKMGFEMTAFNDSANEDTLMKHENMLDEYSRLENTLQNLNKEYKEFLYQLK